MAIQDTNNLGLGSVVQFLPFTQFITRRFSMTEQTARLPLIGDKAPSFKAETTQGAIQFPQD